MDFEQCLYIELSSVDNIGKVFPLNVIEGTKAPFCVYESSDGIEDKTLSGYIASKEIDGSIYVIQPSYTSMKSVSRAVIDVLKSFQNRKIGDSVNGVLVLDMKYENIKEIYDPQTLLYQNTIGFTIRI